MIRYSLKRLAYLLPTALVPLALVFILIQLGPGDPAAVMLGGEARPEDVEALRERWGLDKPILIQFAKWLQALVFFDLGTSLFTRTPVVSVIMDYLPVTLILTAMAFLIASILGITAGIISALRPNGYVDRAVMAGAITGVSMPEFWLGLNLILIFSVGLRWFPVAGYVPPAEGIMLTIRSLALPALALGIVQGSLLARITRSSMLDSLGELFVKTARSKGIPEFLVIMKHAFRNAIIPILTVLGLILANLISGAVSIEVVFNLPGIGRLMLSSVVRRDFPMIQGIILYIAVLYILVNLLVDLIYAKADPRVRFK